MNVNAVNDLLQRYLRNDCTADEKILVEEWYNRLLQTGDIQLSAQEKQELKIRMEKNILEKVKEENAESVLYKAQFHRRKIWWAAAACIGLLGAGLLFFANKRSAAGSEQAKLQMQNDVKAPASNRATITLANGEQVFVDSALGNNVLLQGNMKLVKLPTGEITYLLDENVAAAAVSYNTVSNPMGSKVLSMQLADGTKFWLNAGSSLTYPVVFTGAERKVDITGEAYFEVAHNKQIPFTVRKGNTEVQVLGTHFNVNAYDDEKEIKVTLLEGSVNVNNGGANYLLKPGEQAQIQQNIKIINAVDVDLVMAWKNGVFAFNGATLEEMMRQIARWYNIKVVYEGQLPERLFGGKIHRDNNLADVLKILGENNIHYRISGNEIVITK